MSLTVYLSEAWADLTKMDMAMSVATKPVKYLMNMEKEKTSERSKVWAGVKKPRPTIEQRTQKQQYET